MSKPKSNAVIAGAGGNPSQDLAIIPGQSGKTVSPKEVIPLETIKRDVTTIYDTAKFIIEAGLLPGSAKTYSVEQTCLVIAMGTNIGIDPISALSMINIIDGKPTLQASAIAALLAKHGVAVEVVQDYAPIYEEKPSYILSDKEGESGDIKKTPQVDEEGRLKVYRNPDGTPLIQKKEVDRVTTLRFKRYMKNLGVITNEISFYWSDARNLGLLEKQNWRRMPRQMMFARTLSRGARIFCSDIVNGMYETSEIVDNTPGLYILEGEETEFIVAESATTN